MKKNRSDEEKEIKSEIQEGAELSILESHHTKAIRLYYEEHNYEEAIKEYESALEEESDETIKNKIRYMIAESYVKIGDLKKAKELFSQLAEKYKEHFINDSARKRLAHLDDHLVERERGKE